jgi:hypothetical protein
MRAKADEAPDCLKLGVPQRDPSTLGSTMTIGSVHQHDGLVRAEGCSPEIPPYLWDGNVDRPERCILPIAGHRHCGFLPRPVAPRREPERKAKS